VTADTNEYEMADRARDIVIVTRVNENLLEDLVEDPAKKVDRNHSVLYNCMRMLRGEPEVVTCAFCGSMTESPDSFVCALHAAQVR
jgi:hypothetical protein